MNRHLVLLLAFSVLAQEPAAAPEPFTGEIEVTEALVDVLVTDRDGNVIELCAERG